MDEQMLQTGFVPPADYGMEGPEPDNVIHRTHANPPVSGSNRRADWRQGPAWKCSDKQKDLILKLVEEHRLDKTNIEALAVERFGKGVRFLNKVEASGLIDELLDTRHVRA